MANFCHRDLVAVMVQVHGEGPTADMVLCSSYLPHDSAELPPTRELQELDRYCRSKKLPLIIGCNANSQHVVWGSSKNNASGSALLEYLANAELEILNRGTSPTFVTARAQCIIDITLCDRRLAHRCVNWRVDQEDSLSDHRCIRREQEERLDVGRVKPSNIERLEDEVKSIHRALTESFHQACPIRPCRVGRKVKWWNRELGRLKGLTRRLWNRAYRTKREEDWTQYRKIQREFKNLIKRSKESAWKTFCEELEALPQVARLRRVFSAGHVQGLGGIILPGGVAITQPDEILEHLIQVHFPDSVIQGEGMCSGMEWARSGEGRPIWGLASKIVTLDRLRWAVDSFEMYKSPGPDGIYPAFLRKGGPLLLHRLLPALRACLALGHVPGRWREVRVVHS
ncbi:uncharacterized protein [Fopius arisanus]|uniref:Endonuclease/exonuclease/phosphatase domain-containing protein n=1 Tax=Fopius arisanus TaxID=64838 RepID=A0A9R1UAK8_9HYME|nr:PREDICTED: uncharacterized protein LOC105272701 [Fopius arisanus]